MKYLFIPMLLGSLFLFTSCNEESINSEESNYLTINLLMPDEREDEAMTRVGLNPIQNSKDLYATWSPNDKVQAILRKGNEMYDLGRVQVTNLSDDKRSATVNFDRRGTPNVAPPYNIYLFTGNDYPASADMIGGGNWAAYCTFELQRAVGGYFHAPLYCRLDVKSDGNIPTAQFQHFGTYELLHVYNATDRPITFAHQGFETERPWYQATHTMWFYDGYDTAPYGEWDGDTDSQTMTIVPGSENIVYSWYIPSGFPVSHARLVACINGNYNIRSTNTFSSTIVPQRGHAYHMYATWDGKELKFKNGDNNEQPTTGIPEGLEAVDLGLPSGTLWANMNVGATTPEEYGSYFAWGETEQKDYYGESTYTYTYYQNGSDAATANWGSDWQMPSIDQIQELLDNTTHTWTTQNGVNGRLFTASNGNSIFLPAAGYRSRDYLNHAGIYGHYWSRSQDTNYSDHACYSYFGWNDAGWYHDYRYYGRSVRPVITPKKQETTTPEGLEAVDLGLPSGTKWANMNVGATAPEEYGAYFAWGETNEKDVYSWETYIHCDGSMSTCHDLGSDIAGTEYDAATANWGSDWQMPTYDQLVELLDNTTNESTQVNGINGWKFTASNGNSIFLPAAGGRGDGGFIGGYYWMSTLHPRYSVYAYELYFTSSYGIYACSSGDIDRDLGLSVRPVYKN